ncbi:hypothetical protein D3C81_1689340 [compost metagenome]
MEEFKSQGTAHRRPDAIGTNGQVGFFHPITCEVQLTIGAGAYYLGAGANLYPCAQGGVAQAGEQVFARHGDQAHVRRKIPLIDNLVMPIALFHGAPMEGVVGDHLGPDRIKDSQAVFPYVDARARSS